jgi:transposase
MVSTGRREELAKLSDPRRALSTQPARGDAHQPLQPDPRPSEDIRGGACTRQGATFEAGVVAGCPADPLVRDAVAALLAAWRVAGERKKALELQLVRLARGSDTCRRMVTVPGVGAITALTFVTAIDDPARFRRSSDVGAFLGLPQDAISRAMSILPGGSPKPVTVPHAACCSRPPTQL